MKCCCDGNVANVYVMLLTVLSLTVTLPAITSQALLGTVDTAVRICACEQCSTDTA